MKDVPIQNEHVHIQTVDQISHTSNLKKTVWQKFHMILFCFAWENLTKYLWTIKNSHFHVKLTAWPKKHAKTRQKLACLLSVGGAS